MQSKNDNDLNMMGQMLASYETQLDHDREAFHKIRDRVDYIMDLIRNGPITDPDDPDTDDNLTVDLDGIIETLHEINRLASECTY